LNDGSRRPALCYATPICTDVQFNGGFIMQRLSLSLASASAVLAFVLTVNPARALDHTWVSSTGSGTACTRAAPCADFNTAYTATSPGGVISVLDSGDFGSLTIQKSITIRAEGVDGGTVLVAGGGFWIQVIVTASDVVSLEGLHFAGAGIYLLSGGSLYIRNCVIRNNIASTGFGILAKPSALAKVVISDTAVVNNGSSGTGAGIWIIPFTGGSAQVTLNRVSAEGNQFGIAVDGSTSTAGINVTITDSVVASNAQDGIVAVTTGGGAPIGVTVKNSKSTNNNIGIRSIGPNVTVRVDNSAVIGNGTGLSFSGGGALLSTGNNLVQANGTNGAFSGPVALQ
jgi:parallel beta helix pectate lyase-like protein